MFIKSLPSKSRFLKRIIINQQVITKIEGKIVALTFSTAYIFLPGVTAILVAVEKVILVVIAVVTVEETADNNPPGSWIIQFL